MNKPQRGGLGRRALALVGAAALALVGTVAMSSAANAAALNPANIDTSIPRSIVVHKHSGTPSTLPGNGMNPPVGDPGPALSGVDFLAQQVTGIDLTVSADWVTAKNMTVAQAQAGPLTPGTTLPTVGGIATFPNLAMGLYLVTEGVDHGDNNIISKSAPFLVTVPYPNATNDTWLYEVHVFPKNKVNSTTPTKTVAAPSSPKLGDPFDWTINTAVPALAAGDTYTTFAVNDALDPRLTRTGTVVTLKIGAAAATTLVLGTDYSMSGANVNFTGALGTMNDNLGTAMEVTVTHTTTVTSLGADGKIVNNAIVNTNGSTKTAGPAQINYGPLALHKQTVTTPHQALTGAEFSVFKTAGDAQANTNAVYSNLPVDASGNLVVAGLFVGIGLDSTENYYVREMKAPVGYLLPAPADAITLIPVTAGSLASATVKNIDNTRQTSPNLPLTGSTGTTMFMLGGLALILAAGGVGLVASSRRRQGTTK